MDKAWSVRPREGNGRGTRSDLHHFLGKWARTDPYVENNSHLES